MPRLSLWNERKTHDFNFIDRIVGEHIFAGGTGVYCHKYIGVAETPFQGDPTRPSSAVDESEVFIQDLLFLENRDRKYSKDIFQLRGAYNIADHSDFDLTQFGLFLANDQVFMTFHENSIVQSLGRRLMPGDVLELPHLRDDLLLGKDDAVNRFLVVKEGARPAEGYDARWWNHLWRVKLGTITDSQEFRDLLGTGVEEDDLRNLISTYKTEIQMNNRVLEQAELDVPSQPHTRSRDHMFMDPGEKGKPPEIVLYGDDAADVPQGAVFLGQGDTMPLDAMDGEYFLRTDFNPNRLFVKQGNLWSRYADDTRRSWTSANRGLETFINNDDFAINSDQSSTPVKTNMSKVILPRDDTGVVNKKLDQDNDDQ
jgi:hypothetical protein